MREFNLLSDYPVLKKRYVSDSSRTIKNRIVASLRGKSFYDGKREDGYGGFKYDGRWKIIAKKIFDTYKLKNNSKILQIGCDKGFLLKDIKSIYPKSQVRGIEISDYAIKSSDKFSSTALSTLLNSNPVSRVCLKVKVSKSLKFIVLTNSE